MQSGQTTKFCSPHLGFVTVILQGAVCACMDDTYYIILS